MDVTPVVRPRRALCGALVERIEAAAPAPRPGFLVPG
jgi:hypothetical protein